MGMNEDVTRWEEQGDGKREVGERKEEGEGYLSSEHF